MVDLLQEWHSLGNILFNKILIPYHPIKYLQSTILLESQVGKENITGIFKHLELIIRQNLYIELED